ncbi:NAD(P)/FAD-dependent oxidoreductase [Micromonospora sp. NPDC048830]|uniref:NAD(P)/FAD-dependent oxidoreductase n=1 Tax=Micromonospora sp. NPDC048830 TaxID=3364257 RepID=UPI003713BE06
MQSPNQDKSLHEESGSEVNRRVLIVGAGVIGCNLAYELTKRGAAVTVIDAAEVASATSSATFAWVNAYNKTPAEYNKLNVLGLEAHERASRTFGSESHWFHQIGNIHIAQTPEEMAALKRKAEHLVSTGYRASVLKAGDVLELEPALDPERISGGVLFPHEGWIDTFMMCSSLLHAAREAGAVFLSYETVTSISSTGITTKRPDGSTRQHEADVTILAAGNGNRPILATADITFPTVDSARRHDTTSAGRPSVGLISTTGPVDSGIRHIVQGKDIALRPDRNGGVTFTDSPTGGQWGLQDPRIWSIPNLLLERAKRLYPSLAEATTETVRLGTRVLPEDGLTIADWIGGSRSIYAVATHSGVTLSAHLGNVVAEEVLGGQRHPSLDSFGLSRFAS